MKGSMLCAALLLAPLGAWSAARPHATSADEQAIRSTLQIYFDGHATGKREVMAGAFHPDARLSWIRDGAYTTRTLEEFLSGFSGQPAPDESSCGAGASSPWTWRGRRRSRNWSSTIRTSRS